MSTMTFEVILPEWCKYVAQDRSGLWYAYDRRPKLRTRDGTWDTNRDNVKYLALGVVPKDWTKELYEVTQ